MESTVEIRYETLLREVRQMPPSQLERLLADVRRLLETRETPVLKYRGEVVEAMQRLEAGEGDKMSLEELHELIEA